LVWPRGERGGVVLVGVGSGVVGHEGLAPGTLVRVEAVRFGCLVIPSPRTIRWWAWSVPATAGLSSIT